MNIKGHPKQLTTQMSASKVYFGLRMVFYSLITKRLTVNSELNTALFSGLSLAFISFNTQSQIVTLFSVNSFVRLKRRDFNEPLDPFQSMLESISVIIISTNNMTMIYKGPLIRRLIS